MKILITGAAGFIGQYVAEHLASDHDIYALARQPLDIDGVRWITHDLTQPLDQAGLPTHIDAVIHLAQSRHYREFPEQAADIYAVNVQSTFALLDYARKAGAKHFIYASTGGVYGYRDEPFRETDAVNPTNFYAASKYAAEVLVSGYRGLFHTAICRFFFVYGVRQSPTMLIPRLVRSVYNGDPITLQGQDGIRINPIHISDTVNAIAQILTLEGDHVLNIGGSEILSLRAIGEIIAEQVGRSPVFTVQAENKPNHLIGDISKMQTLLSAPRTSFREGVAGLGKEMSGSL